ncbi:MAG TPA: putative 2OG-Fe(II) oxygenase [Burkholderiales bacterium]|nr:putative 2OG-Fe(II) oxygenase [Burkholderiales bacterium]
MNELHPPPAAAAAGQQQAHLPLFSTPLSMYDLPGMDEINRHVTERLVAESATVASEAKSNAGGWHSPSNLALRPDPLFRKLVQQIVQRVGETVEVLAREVGQSMTGLRMGAQAWAMVMRDGDYTIPHDHADAHWSTVYYTDAGDADQAAHPDSGLLALIDPRHGGRPMPGLDLFGTTFLAQPRTGRLFVFPGWLYHYVHAYRGKRPRVCVSCNVTIELPSR